MKKIIIVMAFLCSHLFAFAEERNSFVSFTFGSSFLAFHDYDYFGDLSGGFTYGYRISSKSFGIIGLDASSQFIRGLVRFGYEYDFIVDVDKNWVPGVNIALLVGIVDKPDMETTLPMPAKPVTVSVDEESSTTALGLGADMGLFLKIGSGKWRGVVRTGVKCVLPVTMNEGIIDELGNVIQHYISAGLRVSF